MQQVAAYLLLAAAVAYLIVRYVRRKSTGNCCGEPECPAAKGMVRKLERLR